MCRILWYFQSSDKLIFFLLRFYQVSCFINILQPSLHIFQSKEHGADEYIKFALGENVKRSSNNNSIRYPQTRMGVEQVYMDAFTRAQEYDQAWIEYEALSTRQTAQTPAPRRDLALEALAEIINSERFITLMNMEGVTVAINSDDAEMARRLNQEAAKSIKYGGMAEEDAWKMVTLNPAKLLHLDDRMGSIKVGKDADLVLWSDNPLSVYAKAEKTMVDGRIYYDQKADAEKQAWIAQERARLVQKMQAVKQNGASTQAASRTIRQLFHCEDIGFGLTEHIR